MKNIKLELFADYFQFYIQDDDKNKGDLSDSWTQEAVDRLFAIAPYAIGIGTVRNMDVPVSLQVCDREPHINLNDWEHVVLSSIKCETGRLVVAGCTDYFPDAKRVNMQSGTYNVLACFTGLDTLSDDELDGDDSYHIYLYPGETVGVKVLKSRLKS